MCDISYLLLKNGPGCFYGQSFYFQNAGPEMSYHIPLFLNSHKMDRAKLRELALANRDQQAGKNTNSDNSVPTVGGDEYILESFKVKPENTPKDQTKQPEFIKPSSVNNRIDPIEVVEENEKLKSKEMLAQFLNIKRVIQDEDDDLDNKNNPLSVDDTDYPDDVVEYTEWKVRELKRIQAELAQYQEETSDDIPKEVLENSPEAKSKYRFLQKYYHKGAFYTDDPILQKRDYSEAVEADRVDRDTLPAVMQVKNFGKKGRTKWTHLTNEDTTAFDYGWGSKKNYDEKIVSKMAGSKQSTTQNGN